MHSLPNIKTPVLWNVIIFESTQKSHTEESLDTVLQGIRFN
jgi:hypothetical protein